MVQELRAKGMQVVMVQHIVDKTGEELVVEVLAVLERITQVELVVMVVQEDNLQHGQLQHLQVLTVGIIPAEGVVLLKAAQLKEPVV